MPRLSILSLSTVFPRPGDPGLGVFVKARLAAMAELAHVRVIAPVPWIEYGNRRSRLPGRVPARYQEENLEIFHPRWFYPPGLRRPDPFWLSKAISSTIRRAAAESPFDILDAHFAILEGIAATRLAREHGKPFSITLRGNEVEYAEDTSIRAEMAGAVRAAAVVIAVSGRLREFALSLGVEEARAVTIPNGVRAEIFHPRDPTPWRERFGMRPQARHVLSVGNLIPLKGHHLVVEAVAALRASGHAVEAWIAGAPGRVGDTSAEIHSVAARHRITEFVHLVAPMNQNDLAGLMNAADVLCLASSREGWPNVVHEALACGTPVVATDVGSVRDLIPGPDFGLIARERTVECVRQALAEALSRTWDRASIAAWGGARTWAAVAREAVDALAGACGLTRSE